jgi:hypothetical protein
MATGYRFEIIKYQVSGSEAKITVKNTGVAPIYHNAYVTVKGVRSTASLKGLLPGTAQEYTVSNLSVGNDETPEPTITSDKILPGETIPYRANLQGSSTAVPETASNTSLIVQAGNRLTFEGENYTVNVFNLQGQTVFCTGEKTADLSALPEGCYIVHYVAADGQSQVKKILIK